MFHTYVTAASGNQVDIDRASFLMDQDLFAQAVDFAKGRENPAQRAWDYYCQAHCQTYHSRFLPDLDPYWDREDERPSTRIPDEIVRAYNPPSA